MAYATKKHWKLNAIRKTANIISNRNFNTPSRRLRIQARRVLKLPLVKVRVGLGLAHALLLLCVVAPLQRRGKVAVLQVPV